MSSTRDEPAGRRRPPRIDQTQVGYEVLSALTTESAHPFDPPVDPPVAPTQGSVAPATDVVFAPRVAARRVVGALLLVALAATAGAAYVAEDRRTTATIGAAIALAVVSLVLYAVRAGSSSARLSISSGHLEVVRGGRRTVVDLTSPHLRIETVGRPRARAHPLNLTWKVLVDRPGDHPLVIDSSMVEPIAFTDALESWRHHALAGRRTQAPSSD